MKHALSFIVLIAILAAFGPVVAFGAHTVVAPNGVLSWHDMRSQYVVTQSKWWTCGAAALATLLSFYYEQEKGEAELVREALRILGQEDAPDGLSMAVLLRCLQRHGVPSAGQVLNLV